MLIRPGILAQAHASVIILMSKHNSQQKAAKQASSSTTKRHGPWSATAQLPLQP